MGVFSKLLGGQTNVQWNKQKAVMTIVVAAILADGDISDEEIARLRSMCVRSPIFEMNTNEEDNMIIGFAQNIVEQLGDKSIEMASANLEPEIRETALCFACEIILADGIVGDQEEQFIKKLTKTLGVSEPIVEAIVQACIIRMRS